MPSLLLLNGETAAATLLGYDLVRVHAALNDLPAALLLTTVLFDVLTAVTRREAFRQTAFWTLMVGTVGALAAVGSGLLAEDAIEHGTAIHQLMERHETMGYIVAGTFVLLAGWRLFRETRMGRPERLAATGLALAGAVVLVLTSRLGGELVFAHAAGIPTATMQREIENRGGGHEHAPGEEHEHAAPAAAGSAADSAAAATAPAPGGHTHAPGTPAHDH